jgi:hypothetical protein
MDPTGGTSKVNPMKIVTWMVASVLSAGTAQAVSPTWAEFTSPQPDAVYKVTQYLQQDEGAVVVLNAGRSSGILQGALLDAYRIAKPTNADVKEPLWIKTGTLKVVQLQDMAAIARVVVDETELSRTFFPKFPNLMAGDLVVFKSVTLTRRQAILPQVTLAYNKLFIDPRARPFTFELKPDAIAMLKAQVKMFADARVPLLMVEGYTDHNGNQSDNQVESYQRAQTIRQYLIDELGFDENRVVAIGFGESELADDTLTPGYAQANRRIVIKAVTE